jgi:pyruvate-formate lyase-activating enzyme
LDKSLYCINLDTTLRVENSGTCRACCLINTIYTDENDLQLNVKHNTFEEILNSPTRKKILNDLKSGIKNPVCNACWLDEEAGRQSKRQIDNKRIERATSGISVLDVSLSNICNLKCRTCDVQKSSFWKEETWDLKLLDNKNIHTREQYNQFLTRFAKSYDDNSLFWKEFEKNIPNLTQFDLYGGEPFLVEKQWDLIKKIVDTGHDKNIKIAYNTNGTLLDLSKIELLKNFKSVKIDFSLDGVNERLYYMRYPTKHETVLKNLQQLHSMKSEFKNLTIDICHTVSILNVFYINEVFREFKHLVNDIYLNLVHYPEYYCVSNIPNNIKIKIIDHLRNLSEVPSWKINELIQYIQTHNYVEEHWNKCWERTKLHDNYRKEHYKDIFPEFASLCADDPIFSKNMS